MGHIAIVVANARRWAEAYSRVETVRRQIRKDEKRSRADRMKA